MMVGTEALKEKKKKKEEEEKKEKEKKMNTETHTCLSHLLWQYNNKNINLNNGCWLWKSTVKCWKCLF